MATNERFNFAHVLSLPVPDGTLAGAPVAVGSIMGVCLNTEKTGGNADNFASVQIEGVFDLSVSGAVASVGLPVYITSGNALNMTASGNTLFGYALATKGSGAAVIPVLISRV